MINHLKFHDCLSKLFSSPGGRFNPSVYSREQHLDTERLMKEELDKQETKHNR